MIARRIVQYVWEQLITVLFVNLDITLTMPNVFLSALLGNIQIQVTFVSTAQTSAYYVKLLLSAPNAKT